MLYRSPVRLDPAFDPAALFESLFAAHGWPDGWRDGIYDFIIFIPARTKCWGLRAATPGSALAGLAGECWRFAPGM